MEATGNCYEANAKHLMDLKLAGKTTDMLLVHGKADGQGSLQGMRIEHCWLLDGDTVYDYSNVKEIVMPKIIYYGIGNIIEEECLLYTQRQVQECIVKYGHWGPWE